MAINSAHSNLNVKNLPGFPWLLDRGIFRVFEMKSGQVETKQEVADLKRTNSLKVMLLKNTK